MEFMTNGFALSVLWQLRQRTMGSRSPRTFQELPSSKGPWQYVQFGVCLLLLLPILP